MIDTITLHTNQPVELSNPIKVTETVRTRTLSYQIKNLDIKSNEYGTTITGSLPKFLNGSNVETLPYQEIPTAIDNLNELTGIDLSESRILRLDWTANISTENPPKSYYSILGETYPYQRIQYKNSLYYNCSNRKALFYDKGKEARVPGHLLRYELRNLNPDLKKLDLRLSNLLNKNTYNSFVEKWLKTYQRLNKLRTIMLNDPIRPSDLKNLVFAQFINDIGKDRMLRMIEENSWRGKITPCNKSRMIEMVRNASKRNYKSNELELELNEKFQEAANMAMV